MHPFAVGPWRTHDAKANVHVRELQLNLMAGVEVDRESARIAMKGVVCVQDMGQVVSPKEPPTRREAASRWACEGR